MNRFLHNELCRVHYLSFHYEYLSSGSLFIVEQNPVKVFFILVMMSSLLSLAEPSRVNADGSGEPMIIKSIPTNLPSGQGELI